MPIAQMWRTLGALLALLLALPRVQRLRSQWQLEYLVFDDSKDYALVYSMPKVGSTSLWVGVGAHRQIWAYYESLNETYKHIAKTHVHAIAKDFLRKVPEGRRIWLFCAVRNPFARLASLYWEDIEMERHLSDLSQEQILAMNTSDLHLDFLQNWTLHLRDDFFSRDLLDAVGVDLSQIKFPFEAGKMMIEGTAFGKQVVVVVLRAEDVKVWWDIMRHNVPTWASGHKQNAKDLWYGAKYQEFRRTFRWPGWAIDELLAGDSLRFYTIAERATFLHRVIEGESFGRGG